MTAVVSRSVLRVHNSRLIHITTMISFSVFDSMEIFGTTRYVRVSSNDKTTLAKLSHALLTLTAREYYAKRFCFSVTNLTPITLAILRKNAHTPWGYSYRNTDTVKTSKLQQATIASTQTAQVTQQYHSAVERAINEQSEEERVAGEIAGTHLTQPPSEKCL